MKLQFVLIPVFAVLVMNSSLAQSKKYEVQVDKEKKEVSINLNKSGTLKAGAGEGPRLPEAAKTERDRRQEQQEKSGKVFVEKTF
jgi:hypothetical protein